MKPVSLIAILSLCFLSCHHKQTSSKKQDTIVSRHMAAKTTAVDADTAAIIADPTQKLLSYSVDHFFSDTLKKDKFTITLYGKNVVDGIIAFNIYNFENQQIYKETFPATDLLADEADVLNFKQQKDTITTRMAAFLNDENFATPAISADEKIEEDFDSPEPADKDNWAAVKADQTSVAFSYSHGYESTYGIAYSKSKKKVVSIFYSD